MEITKREIILSISIVVIMFIIGLLITNHMNSKILDNNSKYLEAVHIDKNDLFSYSLSTSVGNAFISGNLIAKDPVKYPELKGSYLVVNKTKEEYTAHTRVVSDGKHTHTET